MTCRSKVEQVRIPSTEQVKIQPLLDDATQMKAQYEHVRTCDYATYNHVASRLRSNGSAQSNILKLATKSCDNIFARQTKRVESPFIWRDTTRSEEQLFPPRQTGARFFSRSRLTALLKKLSPRPRRSKSQACPWVVIEFNDAKTRSPNHLSPGDSRLEERSASVESDKSFEIAVELSKKRLNVSGQDISHSKLIVSSGNMPTIVTPKILIVSPEKTSYRKHQNKYTKPRKHRSSSGGTCPPSAVASRPRTLTLTLAGEKEAAVGPRMASLESIGSCSLDADVTASCSASELCDSASVSELTLHSLALSARTTPEYVKRTAQLFEPSTQNGGLEDLGKENYPGGGNTVTNKPPSYLGLACSVSGYTTITNYDSKLREGFRSRDHSPGRLVIRSREASPIERSDRGNYLSPPRPTDRINGSVSSTKGDKPSDDRKLDVRTLRNSLVINGGPRTGSKMSANSDENVVVSGPTVRESTASFMSTMLSTETYATASIYESRNGSNGLEGGRRHSPGAVRVVEFTSQAKSYVRHEADPRSRFLESGPTGRDRPAEPKATAWTGTPSDRSFVRQRVERLYGPGALAQGFFRRASSTQQQSTHQGVHESSSPGSQAALPVLRHLRPEFRAQLSLGSRKESRNKENQVVKIIPVELDNEHVPEKIYPVEGRKAQPILQAQVSVESICEQLPAAPEVVLPPKQVATPIVQSDAAVVKDGRYFLIVLRQEIERLNKMVEVMERNMESGQDIPEEVSGQLRAATGQARLLVKQKLQQFEGLCHKNMAQDPEEQFPTTCEDLAGFWDMVKLQVDQVHGLFADLDRLKAAGWNKEKLLQTDEVDGSLRNSTPKKRPGGPTKRASKTAAPSVNEEARKAREEGRRKLMEEKRRQMREKSKQATEDIVEIFVPQENGK